MTSSSTTTSTSMSMNMMMSNDLVEATKQSLKTLNAQRQALEQEGAAITAELMDSSQAGKPPMGIDTPLVDAEGYPRADIDLYRARSLRGRLAQIRTNHTALMKDIERTLQQLAALQQQSSSVESDCKEQAARSQPKPKPKYDAKTGKWVVCNWDGSVAGVAGGEHRSFHDVASSSPEEAPALARLNISSSTNAPTETAAGGAATASSATSATPQTAPAPPLPTRPFCRVNSVAPHSPAAAAGLRPDDLILQFGTIDVDSCTTNNDDPMSAVAQLVPQAAGNGSTIALAVKRKNNNNSHDDDSIVRLQLQPRPWNGRGLLGCHILPIND